MLYPEADIDKFDIDNIVVDDQIVDPVAPTSDVVPNAGKNPQEMPLDLAALDHLLNEEDNMEERTGGAGGHGVTDHVMIEAGRDSEETL